MISKILSFIAKDGQRFAIEVALAIALSVIAFYAGYLVLAERLNDCQADRVEMGRTIKSQADFQHSIFYGQQLKAKDQLIQQKDEEILQLRKKATLDSIAHMATIDAMGAINERYRSQNR